jgi:phosphonate transport system permease protein
MDNINNLKIKKPTKAGKVISMTIVVLFILTIYGLITFDYKNINILKALLDTLVSFKKMSLEARFSHFTFGEAIYALGVTMGLAFLTTLIGSFIALVLSLFAAQNLSTKKVSNIIKSIVAFIRAVPTVLWILIFAIAAGLGSVAAVIGMTFHTIGYLIKAYSESFEELDEGVLEALKASGANWLQIVFQAVIPSSITYILSWTFIRFEINYLVSITMGAAAGAGGIGYDLFWAGNYYFDIREVGLIAYFTLIIAIVLEFASVKFKKRLTTR